MDFSFDGSARDPSKCSKLGIDEKREFVYQVSKCAGASEMLQSWSRQEILQILCVEMGKERKYTGLTKLKIIEHLLKIVSEKKAGESETATDTETESSAAPFQRCFKRQRKTDNPSRLTVPVNSSASNNGVNDLGNAVCCKNSACRATLKQDDKFCKRCSCCICYKYDDNKDPSLWLTCGSELPFEGVACGMSCHLDCALKHENSCIGKDGYDGSFRCIACWKINDLLGCWRKQLFMAKDTRRVDILCYRLSLSQKLLNPTGKYRKIYEIVDGAVKQLQDEVGPSTGLPVKMGRGIVNRLSFGPEIQKHCALALESLDELVSNLAVHQLPDPMIRDTNAAGSAIVRSKDVNAEERSQSPATNCSSLSNPSSVEDETNHNAPCGDQIVNRADNSRNLVSAKVSIGFRTRVDTDEERTPADEVPLSGLQMVAFVPNPDANKLQSNVPVAADEISTDNRLDAPIKTTFDTAPFTGNSEASLPITPCKLEITKDVQGRHSRCKSSSKDLSNGKTKGEEPRDASTSKKRRDEECEAGNRDFEYYVKVIRWLECEGHIEKNFRQKFLTWYGLRASPQEIRVVKAFVDTFIQDPASLAEQLVDTFYECVSSRTASVVPAGFCMKLWH